MVRSYAPENNDRESDSPLHLPLLHCVSPLPHLSSVAFFSTSRASCHRYGWRPQPPTPARGKMSPKDRDAHLFGAKPCRTSISAIPRPARPASTRRSSKSCLTTADGFLSPEKARCPPHRRSVGVKSDNPPSSYHLPRNLLPRSESFLMHFEDFSPIEDVFNAPARGLSKSQTTPALLSPKKNITSHRLIRPLDPPLPRSNTYDEFLSPKRRSQHEEPAKQLSSNNTVSLRRFEKRAVSSKSPYPFESRITAGVERDNITWSLSSRDSAISSANGSDGAEVDPRLVRTTLPHSRVSANL